MAERQKHGFLYEEYIFKKYPQIIPNTNYTGEWDGYINSIPVSIKYEMIGSDIELADFFLNAAKTTDFYLFVGFHDSSNQLVEEYVIYVPINEWRKHFCYDLLPYFKRLITNITNSYDDDERWTNGRKLLASWWEKKTDNIIRPRFKRDHKTQKRMQCAINNKDFYKIFIPMAVKL